MTPCTTYSLTAFRGFEGAPSDVRPSAVPDVYDDCLVQRFRLGAIGSRRRDRAQGPTAEVFSAPP